MLALLHEGSTTRLDCYGQMGRASPTVGECRNGQASGQTDWLDRHFDR